MAMLLLLLALMSPLGGAQTEPARPILAPIVRTQHLGAGVVRIVFDVNGEASARFSVTLEASNDNGRTFAIRARSTTGDVGPGVAAGPGKVIT